MKVRIDPLDRLFSEYVRRKAIGKAGGCERCLAPKTDYRQLQCAHFHGRAQKSVRYDEDNCAGLCMGCHVYLDSHPLEKVEWFKQRLGEVSFDLLNARTRIPGRYLDKEALKLYYRVKIKEFLNA